MTNFFFIAFDYLVHLVQNFLRILHRTDNFCDIFIYILYNIADRSLLTKHLAISHYYHGMPNNLIRG